MASNNQELEAKFYIADLEALRVTLEGLGAVLVQPRTLELNLRFDDPEGTLTRSAQVLRLRRDTQNRLTYKGPPKIEGGVSARTEIEFTLDDFENAQALFKALGYQISMIYEKYRAMYRLGDVLVTLDEMPFGSFAEIEGPDSAQIQAVCREIGLLWPARTLQSYGVLFNGVKQKLGLAFRDLTFENFAEIRVAPSHLGLIPADLNIF